MPRTVNVHEAKTHLSQILADVQAGDEVIIARSGKPCARLVPIDRPAKRRLGFVTGRITDAFFDELGPEELSTWE